MSDTFSNKNSKVKVMFVDSENSNDKKSTRSRQNDNKRQSDNKGSRRSPRWGDKNLPASPSRPTLDKPIRNAWHARLQEVDEAPLEEFISSKDKFSNAEHVAIRRQRNEESKVYGEKACQRIFEKRPGAIIRAYFVQGITPRFKEALRWLAANRKAYHVVDAKELQKITGTEHHGGVCFLIKKRESLTVEEYLDAANRTEDCVIAIENVGNPHNLGAIMRNAAYFGANAVMTRDIKLLDSGAALRTAEGGAEFLDAIDYDDVHSALMTFKKAGYQLVAPSLHKGKNFSEVTFGNKVVLVVNQEQDGLSDAVLDENAQQVKIEGTGHVDALNIAVATGILLAKWRMENLK